MQDQTDSLLCPNSDEEISKAEAILPLSLFLSEDLSTHLYQQ